MNITSHSRPIGGPGVRGELHIRPLFEESMITDCNGHGTSPHP